MGMTGLFGGAFDPPHNGHLALAKTAITHFGLERLLVLVVVDPGHRDVQLDFDARLRLAQLAFDSLDGTEVLAEEQRFTVDALRERLYEDPIFLVGADEFAGFLTWKDPDGVLEEARLGVATRPGYARSELEAVLESLERPDRIEFFEIPAVPVSGTEVRLRASLAEPLDGLVPASVAREIGRLGLYR
jgi:nicotinate-nucleotide adenylyltransferase